MKVFILFLLYTIATLLFIPFTIANLILVSFKYKDTFTKSINEYLSETIRELDIFVGNNFRTLFNRIMLNDTVEYYKFGTHNRETISSVLGKNVKLLSLTTFGKFTVKTLDFFDKDHCENSIDSHIKRGDVYCKDCNISK